MTEPTPITQPSSDSLVPGSYPALLSDLKQRIQRAEVRAGLSVNREMVLLHWSLEREIMVRQESEGWGAKVIDRLSRDLRAAFPEMKGFSSRNLKYMRAFAEAYPDESFVQQAVAQIPWGHNLRILDAVSDPVQREWHIAKAVESSWSRNVLVLQIESRLFERRCAVRCRQLKTWKQSWALSRTWT